MTKNERLLFRRVRAAAVSDSLFLRRISARSDDAAGYIADLLRKAHSEKNQSDCSDILFVIQKFSICNDAHASVLCGLLHEKWHRLHYRIIDILCSLNSPRIIDSLFDAVTGNYAYLNYEQQYSLIAECIRTIGRIKCEHSGDILKILSLSENSLIRYHALQQLSI